MVECSNRATQSSMTTQYLPTKYSRVVGPSVIGPIEFMDDVEGTPVMLTKLKTMINSIDNLRSAK